MKRKYWFGLIGICAVLLVAIGLYVNRHTHTYGEEIPIGKGANGYTFMKTCTDCGEETLVHYDALLTFVDDDAKMQAMLHWERIIDETGITMTAAVIPGKVPETTDYETWWAYAGWDLISRLQEKGVDLVNHTYGHNNLTKLTVEEIHKDLQKAKSALKNRGVESNILVYPNNAYNDDVISAVDDYFDVAFACKNEINTGTISKNYVLRRMNINDKSVSKVIAFDAERIVECYGIKPVEKLKEDMNKALKVNGWLVYMVHAYDSPGGQYFFDEESEETIISFCKYVQTLENVKIVNLTQGIAASAAIQ